MIFGYAFLIDGARILYGALGFFQCHQPLTLNPCQYIPAGTSLSDCFDNMQCALHGSFLCAFFVCKFVPCLGPLGRFA